MPLSHLPASVSALFYALAHCLDRRLHGRFPQLLVGVLFARGRRTVTAWFRAAGITDAYRQGYRTLATAGRQAELLSTCLLPVVRPLQPGDRLTVALDDTPTPRWGAHVEGAGVHRNPTPGPAGEQYVYGHVWVTLAALVTHPTQGVRALPLRSDLYVRRKDVTPQLQQQGFTFATKLERAVEQVRWLNTWVGPWIGTLEVVVDGAYAKRPLLGVVAQLPRVTLFSRLAKNAALWSLPPTKRRKGQRGPLPTYGKQRIDLAKRAGQKRGWQRVSCVQYGRTVTKRIKTFLATWRPAGGMIRVVLVQESAEWRAYFCTDPGRTAREVLERAAERGALEETFKDLKEVWGAGQQQLRNVWANVGAFNVNGWLYSAVEAWAWQRSHEELVDRRACPWDKAERRASHADKRKALQRQLLHAETLRAVRDGPDSAGFQQLLDRLLCWMP
jgi:DDE superfamily endonuclease